MYARQVSWKRLLSSTARGTPTAIAVLCVLTLYAYFGGGGSFDFRRLRGVEDSLYANLAEGFSRGHLYMASAPDARLARLSDPYDPAARGGINYIWDASYFNGRYYLYFSPLPALIFYMPYRTLRGGYLPIVLRVWCSVLGLSSLLLHSRTSPCLFLTMRGRDRFHSHSGSCSSAAAVSLSSLSQRFGSTRSRSWPGWR